MAAAVQDAPDPSVTHPLRPQTLAGVVTWVIFALGVLLVYRLCRDLAPSVAMNAWLVGTGVFVVIWGGFDVAMLVRRPDAEEQVRIWGRAARFIIYGSNLSIAAAIWLFFPHCPADIRLFLTAMFVTCSPSQIIASPENVSANRLGAAVSYGSLALWLWAFGIGLEAFLAAFVVVMGGVMIILANVIPKTVGAVVTERLASDEAARRLAQANAQVIAERDAKTHFIAAASHDLGQPLQAAALYFDQAMSARDATARERAAKGVRTAFAATDELLSHMLNHLRLEADAVQPQVSTVRLASAFRRLSVQYRPAARAAGMRLNVVGSRYSVLTDPALLDRALGNLVHNAVQHSTGERVLVGARKHRGNLRVWVIDDGAGVDPTDTRNIFQDYYRGGGSAAPGKGGFGLGLSSALRISKLLGGDAGLDERWRGGAAFYLEFAGLGGGRYGLTQRRQERLEGE